MKGLDSLDLFDFGILLQALSNNLKVGILAVRSEGRVKYLQLDRTKLVCVYTERPKVTLGKILSNHRSIEKAHVRDAIEAIREDPSKGPLGRCLRETGRIDAAQLRRACCYQMLEEVLELFYWKNVGFKFINGGTRASLP